MAEIERFSTMAACEAKLETIETEFTLSCIWRPSKTPFVHPNWKLWDKDMPHDLPCGGIGTGIDYGDDYAWCLRKS